MTSLFAEAAIDASAAVDDVYGESLRITPMTEGRYQAGAADSDRVIFDVTGAFFEAPDRIKMQSTKVGRDFFQQFVGAKCFASIDKDLLAEREIKKGDRLTRLDEPGQPQYEVTVPGEIEVQRMIYALVVVEDAP